MAKGISLHIGLNAVSPAAYGGWSGVLGACEADAKDMAALAKKQRFSTTTTFLTKAATRAKVLAGIASAAKALRSGDLFFLTYSGHGGQLPDLNGDEDDGQDETWCLYDGQVPDDELHAALCGFAAGVRVLMLSDSCHSGTVSRMLMTGVDAVGCDHGDHVIRHPSGWAYRAMPPQFALPAYEAKKTLYDGILTDPKNRPVAAKASILLISGCQDSQLSQDGTFNGLFTGTLKRVWANGAFHQGHKAFHKAIVARMPPTQQPNLYLTGASNAAFLAQVPFTI